MSSCPQTRHPSARKLSENIQITLFIVNKNMKKKTFKIIKDPNGTPALMEEPVEQLCIETLMLRFKLFSQYI